MTANLLDLTNVVTKDTEDTLLEAEIRKNHREILKALSEGRDYILKLNDRTVVIKAKKPEKIA
ncbi:MAG: hypothetical protein ACHP7P_05455 [Terriglobales bacterium]